MSKKATQNKSIEHNCIQKIREDLMKQDPTIQYIEFKLSTIVSITKTDRIKKTGQQIIIGTIPVRKDGLKKEKRINTFISHDFCPFCGIRYNDLLYTKGKDIRQVHHD